MQQPVNAQYSIFIGPNVKFEGAIFTPTSANIEGEVVGKVEAKDLLIGKTGQVTGDVTAERIHVHGQLGQEVSCSSHLVIHESGQLSGTVLYATLEIMRGGKLEGSLLQIEEAPTSDGNL